MTTLILSQLLLLTTLTRFGVETPIIQAHTFGDDPESWNQVSIDEESNPIDPIVVPAKRKQTDCGFVNGSEATKTDLSDFKKTGGESSIAG